VTLPAAATGRYAQGAAQRRGTYCALRGEPSCHWLRTLAGTANTCIASPCMAVPTAVAARSTPRRATSVPAAAASKVTRVNADSHSCASKQPQRQLGPSLRCRGVPHQHSIREATSSRAPQA